MPMRPTRAPSRSFDDAFLITKAGDIEVKSAGEIKGEVLGIVHVLDAPVRNDKTDAARIVKKNLKGLKKRAP